MNQKTTGIIVDYDMFSYYGSVRRWLKLREKFTTFILLVTDPEHNDYDPGDSRWHDEVPFDVVIRNAKTPPLPDLAFKTAALCAVQENSNVIPVIALDQDLHVQQMFEDGGVLIANGESDLLYV